MLRLIGTVFVGFVFGLIAKLIMPRKENRRFVMTTLLGILGALRATHATQRALGTTPAKAPVGSARRLRASMVLFENQEQP